MKKKKLFAQADWQASYDKRKHTEDCLEANDDTSPMKGKCICPKAQHTPTPWEVGPHAIDIRTVDNNIDAVHVVCTMPGPNANQEYRDREDAAFIVRAVNAHDDLLEALKIAEAFMEGFEDDEIQVGIGKRLKWIRDAIKKAEGL